MTRVLIVDDSLTDAYRAEQLSLDYFSEVMTVCTARGFFIEMDSYKPDLVLMDVMIGEVENGFALISEWRSIEVERGLEKTPIAVVSSKTAPEDRDWAFKQGAQAYLTKPITRENLIEAIKFLLPLQSLEVSAKGIVVVPGKSSNLR